MEKYCDKKDRKIFTRESIIGLGEDSFRKNYYPELQEKIIDLERINARNKAIISTIPDILFVSDPNGEIVPFTFMENIDGFTIREIFEDQIVMSLLREAVKEAAVTKRLLTKEFQIVKREKILYYEARLHKSETDEILIIIRDMTERILLENQLRDLVERDALTKIPNRWSFEKKLDQYTGRVFKSITMISIDVNGLKFINDTIGHLSGDKVIIASGNIICEVFEKYGHVARIGGDEFGIILEGIEEDKVERLLIQLNEKVEKYNLTDNNGGLSLAYGYSYHENGIVNMEFLFQEADNNMYQNKLLKKQSIRSTFVKTFMKALEAKDYVSEGHVSRMEKLAVQMGAILLLHQDQMDKLVLLTKFHDIGKIGIPDSILKKPAKLTEDEWNVMRTHSAIGERIAVESAELKDIAHLILKHHEKWNGTGYPLGLCEEEIPIECRILAIVDTFDAMTNNRPYRVATSVEEARKEISECRGTQFDPKLVEIFCTIQEYL